MKKFVFISIIVLIGFFGTACVKDPPCQEEYQFKLPVSIYAKADTISLKDTVVFSLAVSQNQKNLLSSDMVYIKADYFRHLIAINKITSDSNSLYIDAYYSISGQNSFTVVNKVGSLEVPALSARAMYYLNRNDSIFGQFLFIANDTGTFVFRIIDFLFTQLNANTTHEHLQLNPATDCETLWRYTLFDNKNPNNYYIIKQRGVYIDTTRYEYPNAVKDKKYNLKHGSFSVVISP